MKIFGINFNHSPSQKKPITIAICDFKKSKGLSVLKVESLYDLKEFDAFLKQKGPWFSGVNFPLGQPNLFLKKMNLPDKWNSYIKDINRWKLDGFEKKVKQFKAKLPGSAKEPLRLTDAMAGAESPLKFTQKQLAMQFYEGTSRLLKAGVSILPCNPKKDTRVVLETFPDLVAQRFAVHALGAKTKNVDTQSIHKEIIKGLETPEFEQDFKFKIFFG